MFPSASASQGNATLDSVLRQYDELFQPELGCYTGEPVVLNDSKGAKFHKARAVPYALQSKVESTLLKMEHGQKFGTRMRTDGFRLGKYCRKAFSLICMGKNYYP